MVLPYPGWSRGPALGGDVRAIHGSEVPASPWSRKGHAMTNNSLALVDSGGSAGGGREEEEQQLGLACVERVEHDGAHERADCPRRGLREALPVHGEEHES